MHNGVAYVDYAINKPKVWTFYAPDFDWLQCYRPIARGGMICKQFVKVFKTIYPSVDDGIIVCKGGTKHNMDHTTLMSQSQSTMNVGNATNVNVVIYDNVFHVGGNPKHTLVGPKKFGILHSRNQSQMFYQIFLGDALNS